MTGNDEKMSVQTATETTSLITGDAETGNGSTGNAAATSNGDNKGEAAGAAVTNGTEAMAHHGKNGSDDTFESQHLWEELEHPWPSTFERSIALLSSPILQAKEVDFFTKSPRAGSTPLAFARRRDLRRGFSTSTPIIPHALRKSTSLIDEDSDDIFASVDRPSFQKMTKDLQQAHKTQEQKAKAAKEYRAKLLKQKQQQGGDDGFMSPGYDREVSVARMAAKHKKEPVSLAGKSTFAQCVFNFANVLMGVGLLGLPFALKTAGWIGGMFCLSVFGVITWRTSILIGRELNGDPRPSAYFVESPWKSPLIPGSCAEARMLPPLSSFPDIAMTSFGEKGCVVLSIILYFELFSCVSIFLVAIGDHLHELFPDYSVAEHTAIAAAISLFPTMILRTPALLSYLSMVGTFSTISVVIAVVMEAFVEGDISESVAAEQFGVTDENNNNFLPYHILWRTSGLPLAFGLVAYCFSGHAIIPSIYSNMKHPQDFEKMVTVSYLVVMSTCAAVAAGGYYMFGATVMDQITLSLKQSSKAAAAMRALTWLMILTAFSKTTLFLFPLAIGMEELIAPYLTSDRMVQVASAAIKLFFTVMAVVVAVYVPSFSLLCALVGMICTMSVSIIFPAAAHMKMFGHKLNLADKILDSVFILIGVVMAIVGTYVTV